MAAYCLLIVSMAEEEEARDSGAEEEVVIQFGLDLGQRGSSKSYLEVKHSKTPLITDPDRKQSGALLLLLLPFAVQRIVESDCNMEDLVNGRRRRLVFVDSGEKSRERVSPPFLPLPLPVS